MLVSAIYMSLPGTSVKDAGCCGSCRQMHSEFRYDKRDMHAIPGPGRTTVQVHEHEHGMARVGISIVATGLPMPFQREVRSDCSRVRPAITPPR